LITYITNSHYYLLIVRDPWKDWLRVIGKEGKGEIVEELSGG